MKQIRRLANEQQQHNEQLERDVEVRGADGGALVVVRPAVPAAS